MILGMTTFAFVHVLITLVPIVSGPIMLFGMLKSERMNTMTAIFLLFMVLTDVTGFMLPFHGATPAVKLDIISCVILIPTLLSRYAFGMDGAWRWIFVLVVQSFAKVPALHALAPTGSEPPFAIVQGLVLLFFVVTGFLSMRRFHPA